MAITDLQISDTLQTSAPSIKYTGNEGPQAPQQMASDPNPEAEWRQIYDNYKQESIQQGKEYIDFEEFIEMYRDISRSPQQDSGIMKAAYGGMMRQKYGLGKFVRKLIPNEIAAIAEKAAPFVAMAAPQFALPAALAAGLGNYDRTGKLGGALKSGALTYGLGTLSPGLPGGMRNVGGTNIFNTRSGLNEMYNLGSGTKTQGIRDLFKSKVSPSDGSKVTDTSKFIESSGGDKYALGDPTAIEKIDETIKSTTLGKNLNFIKELTDSTAKKIILGSMVGTGLYTAYTQGKAKIEDVAEVARGEGLDIAGIRKEVQDALAGGEEAWNELKRTKYPYMGEFPTKKAEGGRIGLYAGGVPSPYSMEDARKTSMQDKMGGITDVMKRADLFRSGDVGQMYRAQGGRIGYRNGIGPNQGSPGIMSQAMTDTEVEDAFGVTLEQERAITDQQVEDAFGISVDDTSPVEIIRYKNLFRRLKEPRELKDLFRRLKEPREMARYENLLGKMNEEKIMTPPIGEMNEEKIMTPLSEQSIYQNLMLLVEMFKNQGMNDADALDAAQSYFGDRGFGRAQGGRIGFDAGKNYEAKIKELMDKGLSRELAEIMVMSGPSSDRYDVDEKASGGRIGAEEGGIMDLGGMEKDYRNDGGFVPIGEYEKKDDVPARLSKNEFVFTADAVRGAGGGDIDKGAEMMENMMKHLEQGGQISEDSQGLAGAQEMFDVSERLGEVI